MEGDKSDVDNVNSQMTDNTEQHISIVNIGGAETYTNTVNIQIEREGEVPGSSEKEGEVPGSSEKEGEVPDTSEKDKPQDGGSGGGDVGGRVSRVSFEEEGGGRSSRVSSQEGDSTSTLSGGEINKAFVPDSCPRGHSRQPSTVTSDRSSPLSSKNDDFPPPPELELERMSGQPAILGSVEQNGGYQDYFMPANSTKKSFRGEKLYVTKSTEGPGTCRKVFCWMLALILLAGAVAVAVLIGAGFIDPTMNKDRKTPTIPGDVQTKSDLPTDDQIGNIDILSLDPSLIKNVNDTVPNALAVNLRIENMEYSNQLSDSKSEVYTALKDSVENGLEGLLRDKTRRNVSVNVKKFTPGSVVVSYIVSWKPEESPVENSAIENAVNFELRENGGKLFGQYAVDPRSVRSRRVYNLCSTRNCSDGCLFEHEKAEFLCTCPDQFELHDASTCVPKVIVAPSVDRQLSRIEHEVKLIEDQIKDIEQNVTTRTSVPKAAVRDDIITESNKTIEVTTNINVSAESVQQTSAEPSDPTETVTKDVLEHAVIILPSDAAINIEDESDEVAEEFPGINRVEEMVEEMTVTPALEIGTTKEIPDVLSRGKTNLEAGTTLDLPDNNVEISLVIANETETDTNMMKKENGLDKFEIGKEENTESPIESTTATMLTTMTDEALNIIPDFDDLSELESNNGELVATNATDNAMKEDIPDQITSTVKSEEIDENAIVFPTENSVDSETTIVIPAADETDLIENDKFSVFEEESNSENLTSAKPLENMPTDNDNPGNKTNTIEDEPEIKELDNTVIVQSENVLLELEDNLNSSKSSNVSVELATVKSIETTTNLPTSITTMENVAFEISTQEAINTSTDFVEDDDSLVQDKTESPVQSTENTMSVVNLLANEEENEISQTNPQPNKESPEKLLDPRPRSIKINSLNTIQSEEKSKEDTNEELATKGNQTAAKKENTLVLPSSIVEDMKEAETNSDKEITLDDTMISEQNITSIPSAQNESSLIDQVLNITLTTLVLPSREETTTVTVGVYNISTSTISTPIEEISENEKITEDFKNDGNLEDINVPNLDQIDTEVNTEKIDVLSERDETTTEIIVDMITSIPVSESTVADLNSSVTEATIIDSNPDLDEQIVLNETESAETKPSTENVKNVDEESETYPNISVTGDSQCSSGVTCGGNCIARIQVCDGLLDCVDGQDEKDCESNQCLQNEFRCSEGRCISLEQRCDGVPDCAQGEDEVTCSDDCTENQFLCSEGRCIDNRMKCDGVIDCLGGEDESGCGCENRFSCQFGGGCVDRRLVCDGVDHCADRSDEFNCVRIDQGALQIRDSEGWSSVCSDSWDEKLSESVCTDLGYESVQSTGEGTNSLYIEQNFWGINTTTSSSSSRDRLQKLGSRVNNSCDATVDLSCNRADCGRWNITADLAAQIAAGNETTAGLQWPSLVLVYHVKVNSSCTATILHPYWLATSVSCLEQRSLDPLKWVMLSGPSASGSVKGSTQIKTVEKILLHPNHRRRQHFLENNLALIKLKEPIDIKQDLTPACLADQDIQDRQLCVSVGWSLPEDNGISFDQYLNYLPVPEVSSLQCNSTEMYNGHITQEVLCTVDNGDSPNCQVDEGSALMCLTEERRWALHGILSRRGTCRQETRPSIYTSVFAVNNWIRNTIGMGIA